MVAVFFINLTYLYVSHAVQTLFRVPGNDFTQTTAKSCYSGGELLCEGYICDGANGVCRGDYWKGCACTENPCPDDNEPGILCDEECGEKGPDGKCKGVSILSGLDKHKNFLKEHELVLITSQDTDGSYKGCNCIVSRFFPGYNYDEHGWEDISFDLLLLPWKDNE